MHNCERSEAIHRAERRKNGLLRRSAPRNDVAGILPNFMRFDPLGAASA
jgi:hypothetical protein